MPTDKGISKKTPKNPSINFKRLRSEGVRLIQALSGESWTDYNLHDPGVTTLEVLCYALTELGYRTDALKEAYKSEETVNPDLIERYFYSQGEIIPSLPLTRGDFEEFIEENHEKVLSAWFESYPLLHPAGTVRGGYEIALMLEQDEQHGNLNTDMIQISLAKADAMLEVNFFDEENRRMTWETIRQVTSCSLDEENPDNFFAFEDFNCQVALVLEVFYLRRTQSETIYCKARATLNPLEKTRKKSKDIGNYQKAIIRKLESGEFLEAIARTLSKAHYKERLLEDIKQTLLPVRNLCEDFISLRVVNEQEVKIDVEIILDDYAPHANAMIQKIYDRLDDFLMQLLRLAKQQGQRSKKNLLYASNLVEEMLKVEGVEAASIQNLNLFIDGVPTIPLKEEAAFECIHLQRFSYYVPRLSREKSSVRFIRSGTVEEVDSTFTPREFTPQRFFDESEFSNGKPQTKPEQKKPEGLDKSFFDALRLYYSIRNDFPKNYRLTEGQLSENAPEKLRIRVRQFKHYLAFFEHILIDYLDKLHNFNDLLSVKQEAGTQNNKLKRLKEELPDLDFSESTSASPLKQQKHLMRKNKLLDHLLARFASHYTPIMAEETGQAGLERTVKDKIALLQDIPLITRERGLGLPIQTHVEKIWDSDLLSGFQKRAYRLLGVKNKDFRHLRLTKVKGSEPVGFYLVEHILLARRDEDHVFVTRFNRDAEVLHDYLSDLSGGSYHYEPYSFQLTLVLPDWYPTWQERRATVERVIKEEIPAHVMPYFFWLNKETMGEFEILYEDWLQSLLRLQTIRPL